MITQRHIAEKLGVSRELVGQALRGRPGVNAGTRRRILAVARKMGYHPDANWTARVMLAKRHSRVTNLGAVSEIQPERLASPPVWLIVRTSSMVGKSSSDQEEGNWTSSDREEGNWMFTDYFHGLLEAFSTWKCGFQVTYVLTDQDDLSVAREIVETGRGSGIINLSLRPDATEYLIQKKFPMVMLNADLSARGVPSVVADHVQGYSEVWRALVELGHRRFAYFGYESGSHSPDRLEMCTQGAEMAKVGMRLEQLIRIPSTPNPGAIWASFVEACGSNPREWPTCIYAHNDMRARSLMVSLQEHGVRVPQDISVIGFDDISIAKYLTPSLSTHTKPRFQMSVVAAQLLGNLLANRLDPDKRLATLPVKFVARGSSSIPRAS